MRLRCFACGRYVAATTVRVVEFVWQSRSPGDGMVMRGVYHPYRREPELPCGPVGRDTGDGVLVALDPDNPWGLPSDEMRWDPQEAEDEIAEWQELLREARGAKQGG